MYNFKVTTTSSIEFWSALESMMSTCCERTVAARLPSTRFTSANIRLTWRVAEIKWVVRSDEILGNVVEFGKYFEK